LSTSGQNTGADLREAKAFFERAEEVAATSNFDYAIDMYLEGLKRAPEAVEEGHKPLRQMALTRQSRGGRKPSVVEKLRHSRAKTPLERMLNAEYLLAKDPEHLPYAAMTLKAAVEGDYKKVAEWIADLLFQTLDISSKSALETYLLLRDSYSRLGQFEKAVRACQYAVKLKPDDIQLQSELRDLYAQLTVQKGRYGEEGDFRKSIRDREKQEMLQDQERVVKSENYRIRAVQEARKTLEEKPDVAVNVFRLADALADMAEDQYENEAVELLEKAYAERRDFSFKQHSGKIQLRRLRRRMRLVRGRLKAGLAGDQAREELARLESLFNATELEHYRLCVENYPTDVRMKYQFGLCLMKNRQYDDAIPMFQEARKDPHTKVAAMNNIGVCFYMKEWFTDAIDVYRQAIDSYEIKDDEIGKDLRYNLARAYEQQDRTDEALELYRKLAQVDYGYKDVHERVDRLRKTGTQDSSAEK
jgi:tetratricopeptide (TPR) repeat protein